MRQCQEWEYWGSHRLRSVNKRASWWHKATLVFYLHVLARPLAFRFEIAGSPHQNPKGCGSILSDFSVSWGLAPNKLLNKATSIRCSVPARQRRLTQSCWASSLKTWNICFHNYYMEHTAHCRRTACVILNPVLRTSVQEAGGGLQLKHMLLSRRGS